MKKIIKIAVTVIFSILAIFFLICLAAVGDVTGKIVFFILAAVFITGIIVVNGGIKNILNFKPKNPILRPFDPFDKSKDDVVNNPNGYTFDTTYGYASLQGIRGFLGLSYTIK